MSFAPFRTKIIAKQENGRDRLVLSGQLEQFSHLFLLGVFLYG